MVHHHFPWEFLFRGGFSLLSLLIMNDHGFSFFNHGCSKYHGFANENGLGSIGVVQLMGSSFLDGLRPGCTAINAALMWH